MARIETYAFDSNLSLDDFVIGSDADNVNVTRNYPLSGLFSTFKTALNLASIEFTFSDGTDPDLDESDAGYFTTNGNQTAAAAVTAINLNTLDGSNIDIRSLLEVVDDQPTAFTLRVFKASVTGQVFYFAVSAVTDNLDDTWTLTVSNFVGGNTLIDATTYSMVFDLSGVPSIYTETDPVFLASPVGGVTAPQVTNWDTAFGWGDHASGGYQDALSGTGIVKSTAGTISYLTDNSTNWNTAFGWGNHASAGYLTSYAETDPVFLASDAAAVTSVKIGTWDLAYTWGDHSVAGYITAETDPVFIASDVFAVTTADINSWDAAYQWGDHASVGYLEEVFVTASTGATDSGNWTKVARIELSAQYENATAFIGYHNSTNGQADARAGFLTIRSKQELALGNDPYVAVNSWFLDETSVDIGYVIVQNTPTSIVDFYVQPNNTYTTIHATAISMDNQTDITWYSGGAYVTTPAGIVEVTSEWLITDAPSDGTTYGRINGAWGAVPTTNLYTADGTLSAARTVSLGGFELQFAEGANVIYINNGRLSVDSPAYGGSRLGDAAFQTPEIDTQTLNFKDTGQVTAVGMFATAVGGSDGYTFTFKNFVDDVLVYNISAVGAADYTDGAREVETTFGLRNDYTAGEYYVFDTFNQDYPSGVATEVRQAQGWVAIHGGGAAAKEIGLWRYDTTTYTQIFGVDASNNFHFEVPVEVQDVLTANSMLLTPTDTEPSAVKGAIYFDDSEATLKQYDGSTWSAVGGGGGGSIGGSITDNQIAVGATTADEIEGSANLTWDLTTLVAEGGIQAENGFVNAKRSGGTADTHIASLGTSSTANNFLVGGSTTGSLTTMDTYLRIRSIADGGFMYQENSLSHKVQHDGIYYLPTDRGSSISADSSTVFTAVSAPASSILTASNTTGSTGFQGSTGQGLYIKGAAASRDFAFWISASTTDDTLYFGNKDVAGTAWEWFPVLTEGYGLSSFDVATSLALSGVTTETKSIEIGTGRSGNGFSYIDLVGDATYTDYGLRFLRGDTGANATSTIDHRGTGNFVIGTNEAADIQFNTSNTNSVTVKADGSLLGYYGIGTRHNSKSGYILSPAGGFYSATTSGLTGAIRIELPSVPTGTSGNSADMIMFDVTIYDYAGGDANSEAIKITISGYPHNAGWANTNIVTHSNRTDRDFTARFYYDATSHSVYIGETSSAWTYPQVVVNNLWVGYNAIVENWMSDWGVTFETSFTGTYDHAAVDNYPTAGRMRTYDNIVVQDSTDRAGLLEIGSTTNRSWHGIQIKDDGGQLWSLMGNANDVGLYDDSADEWIWSYDKNAGNIFRYNGVTKLSTTSGGITVVGDGTAVDWNATSDARLKDNIRGYIDAPIEADWKTWEWKEGGKTQSGLVAQQLELTHPEYVKEDDEGIKSISYNQVFINKISHLENENREYKERIEDLESQMEVIIKKIGL